MQQPNLNYRDFFYNHYASSKKNLEITTRLQSRKPFLMRIIQKHFPLNRDTKIIDLGCGDGAILYFAKKMGYDDLTGYDLSQEQVQLSQSIGLSKIFLKDALQAIGELPNDIANVIVTFDVIEHMTKNEVVEFSKAIHRVLKSNGKWIIHTLNAESPFFGRIRYGDMTHENGFTNTSIHQLLTLVGFQKINCYEDTPVIHGIKSALRFFIWKIIRNIYRFCLAAETGETNGIFSQNFLVVAEKYE